LGVRVIDLAPDKSRCNCEGGQLRWKIVRSGNGGVRSKSHRCTGLRVLGAHVSKRVIGVRHRDASYIEIGDAYPRVLAVGTTSASGSSADATAFARYPLDLTKQTSSSYTDQVPLGYERTIGLRERGGDGIRFCGAASVGLGNSPWMQLS
jgi:hypothetical protein